MNYDQQIRQRILSRVMADPITGCWRWIGTTNGKYPTIFYRGKTCLAHRLSYRLFVGPIPDGKEIDHVCNNRLCVNPSPSHLFPKTHAENTRRSNNVGGVNSRKTHCKKGHPFTQDSVNAREGRRRCRTCQRAADRNRKRAAKGILYRSRPTPFPLQLVGIKS